MKPEPSTAFELRASDPDTDPDHLLDETLCRVSTEVAVALSRLFVRLENQGQRLERANQDCEDAMDDAARILALALDDPDGSGPSPEAWRDIARRTLCALGRIA
jgi:hypothetical protein